MGLSVNIGIRPEDFVIAEADGAYLGNVDIIEALGEVTLVYFTAQGDDEPVVAKLPGVPDVTRGQELALTAHPDKVHIFADGQSLLYRD